MPNERALDLLRQELESENMQKAAALFEEGVKLISANLIQPLHSAIEASLGLREKGCESEWERQVLDFYLNHFQYKDQPSAVD
jgi:hypothetical protein